MASKYKAENEKDRCVACGVCVKVCPKNAISIYKGCYAEIDETLCIGCGPSTCLGIGLILQP